ncbi:uncharacterized protein LOC144954683, partial [Lampetra fluviatilis]
MRPKTFPASPYPPSSRQMLQEIRDNIRGLRGGSEASGASGASAQPAPCLAKPAGVEAASPRGGAQASAGGPWVQQQHQQQQRFGSHQKALQEIRNSLLPFAADGQQQQQGQQGQQGESAGRHGSSGGGGGGAGGDVNRQLLADLVRAGVAQDMAVAALRQTNSRGLDPALAFIAKMGYLDAQGERIVAAVQRRMRPPQPQQQPQQPQQPQQQQHHHHHHHQRPASDGAASSVAPVNVATASSCSPSPSSPSSSSSSCCSPGHASHPLSRRLSFQGPGDGVTYDPSGREAPHSYSAYSGVPPMGPPPLLYRACTPPPTLPGTNHHHQQQQLTHHSNNQQQHNQHPQPSVVSQRRFSGSLEGVPPPGSQLPPGTRGDVHHLHHHLHLLHPLHHQQQQHGANAGTAAIGGARRYGSQQNL